MNDSLLLVTKNGDLLKSKLSPEKKDKGSDIDNNNAKNVYTALEKHKILMDDKLNRIEI